MVTRTAKLIGAAVVIVVAAVAATAVTVSGNPLASTPEDDPADSPGAVEIARLTGPESINRTDEQWDIGGTDLGHMFEHGDRLYLVLGDTFSGHSPGSGGWRSNALAWSTDDDPSDGLRFDGMVTDAAGAAAEILDARKDGGEVTVIPTYGISTGAHMVLHYMSVAEWGEAGDWRLNHSGLAYSDDDGQTWTKDPDATWPGDSNFGQVAFVDHDDHVYAFGIPGGRLGGVQLARVEQDDVLDLDRYQYWDGGQWRPEVDHAAELVPPPVGELSVRWNSHYHKWIMMYLNDEDRDAWGTGAVVARTAECLTGPWSDERVILTSFDVPQLYAPYIAPRWNDGPDVYFTLSRFDHYDVYWWRTELAGEAPGEGAVRCI